MTTEIRAKMFEPIPQEVDALAASVIDAAFQVHKALGPGLLESVYETCLSQELKQRGIPFNPDNPSERGMMARRFTNRFAHVRQAHSPLTPMTPFSFSS